MQLSSDAALLTAAHELIAIESTAANPAGLRAAYEYMRQFIQASGKTITIEEFEYDDKPSLLAYHGQDRPERFQVIFNAHLDVVPGKPEQFAARIQDGKLYGRGAYDMKAAAIVLAQVFCEYVDKVPYALGLQIVTDEEHAGERGTQYQLEQGVRADFVLCGECGRATGTYEIANEAKGVAALELRFDGTATHGAYPWRGDNAALKAADFIRKLYQEFPVPKQATSETTFTVTGMSAGGVAHNQTPDCASVRLDCRYAPDDPRFESPAAITNYLHSVDANAKITKFLTHGLPIYASPHNPWLLELKAAAEQIEQSEFKFVRRNGSGDARFYTQTGGQACEFGIAGKQQHGDDEHITLEAFHNYLETMRAFMQKTLVSEQLLVDAFASV